MNQLEVKYFATQPYTDVWQQLRNFTNTRNAATIDQFWFLDHFPVFTQGQAGKPEHLLNAGDIPVIKTDRGGQITYHGPGQLIVYFLIDLTRKKLNVHGLVRILERSIIELLHAYGIASATQSGAPGVYVNDAKICSIGLRVRNGCTYHGLSLNVDMDLAPFSRINPCGYPGLAMTQIKDLVPDITLTATIDKLLPILTRNLQYPRGTHEHG